MLGKDAIVVMELLQLMGTIPGMLQKLNGKVYLDKLKASKDYPFDKPLTETGLDNWCRKSVEELSWMVEPDDYKEALLRFREHVSDTVYKILHDLDRNLDVSPKYDLMMVLDGQYMMIPMDADTHSRLLQFLHDELEGMEE